MITLRKPLFRIPRMPQGPQYLEKGEQMEHRTFLIGLNTKEDCQKILQLMMQLSIDSENSEDQIVKNYIENEKKKYLV